MAGSLRRIDAASGLSSDVQPGFEFFDGRSLDTRVVVFSVLPGHGMCFDQ